MITVDLSSWRNAYADENLSDLLDAVASDGKEYFGDCDSGAMDLMTAAFLRSSHGEGTFSDTIINNQMALILSAGNDTDAEKFRKDLCAYLSSVARNAAQDHIDTVLPGKYHDIRYYARQGAEIDRGEALSAAVFDMGATLMRFGVK